MIFNVQKCSLNCSIYLCCWISNPDTHISIVYEDSRKASHF